MYCIHLDLSLHMWIPLEAGKQHSTLTNFRIHNKELNLNITDRVCLNTKAFPITNTMSSIKRVELLSNTSSCSDIFLDIEDSNLVNRVACWNSSKLWGMKWLLTPLNYCISWCKHHTPLVCVRLYLRLAVSNITHTYTRQTINIQCVHYIIFHKIDMVDPLQVATLAGAYNQH